MGYGRIKLTIPLLLFLINISLISALRAEASDKTYLDSLIAIAEQKQAQNNRYWEILLHYQQSIAGYRSQIDDPDFFLSPEGMYDPKKELEETLKAFFREQTDGDNHPRCRFIARYAWLKEELNIDDTKLPAVSCNEFNEAYGRIMPKSAALVFPAAYVNGPASTFGHTLIRIDSDYQSKLLSYAVTYAAFADDTNGVLYALKGIFGYYKGYFTILPYYEKIKEYNDLEHRDIWEYRLNLSDEEVKRMFLHLWELKDVYSDYYFFDENCSYALLFLLEAARPSLNLTDKFGSWVIPIDTLRAIKDEGLVLEAAYRPSKGTKIRHIASLLDKHEQHNTLLIADKMIKPEEISASDADAKVRILDLASEIIHYKFIKGAISQEQYQISYLDVLRERSRMGTADDNEYNISKPVQPELGHSSSRLSLETGFQNKDLFQEVRYRAAQHELSDPDTTYIEGSEIVFFSVAVRNTDDHKGLQLSGLDLIDIVSLSPRDIFFQPMSWKARTGVRRKLMNDGREYLVYYLNSGGGFAWRNDILGLHYILLEMDMNLGSKYKNGCSFGIGSTIGIIRPITDIWKLNLSTQGFYYEIGDEYDALQFNAEHVIQLSRETSLNVDFSWMREHGIEQNEMGIKWSIYF